MSRHERHLRLRHILDHAKEAVAMARDRTRAELDSDRQLNLFLVRLLEIAAKPRMASRPKSGRAILIFLGPRSSAADRLIHGYDSVDFVSDVEGALHHRRMV